MSVGLATRVWVKQYMYIMDGKYTDDPYLHQNHKVSWRSAETRRFAHWHGEWYSTHNRNGMKIHFDFEGREEMFKWTWLKGQDGIDYKGRWIVAQFVCDWASHDQGEAYVQVPTPSSPAHVINSWEIVPT